MTSSLAQSRASIGEAQYQTPRPSNSRKIVDREPAIARAACDHHGARVNADAFVGIEHEGAVGSACNRAA